MRIVVFIGYLCFLLCGGSHNFYADTQSSPNRYVSSQNISENHQVKFTTSDQCNIVIEDTDLDIEEEHLRGDEVKKGNDTNFLVGKSSLPDNWRSTYSNVVLLNYYNKGFTVSQSFCDNSSPIYIKNRTLRI